MFEMLLTNLGIESSRFSIKPFNIKDPSSFIGLDPEVPNLINVYSEWSAKKVGLFQDQGLETIRLEMPKLVPVSGTQLRRILANYTEVPNELSNKLVMAGLIPEALPGLLTMLEARKQVANEPDN